MSAIEVDAFLPHPPALVWRALTEPDLLARWLMPNDFRPQVGHRFTFHRDLPGIASTVFCEVLELSPQRSLTISWRGRRTAEDEEIDTQVTWRLVSEGRGTRLFIRHDGFDDDDPGQLQVMSILGGGWRSVAMEQLRALLHVLEPGGATGHRMWVVHVEAARLGRHEDR